MLKMKKFLKRESTTPLKSYVKKRFLEVDLEYFHANLGERKQISCYHPNNRDNIRRVYLQKEPCQPREHDFPKQQFKTLF